VTDELRFERLIAARSDVVFDAFTSQPGQEAFYGNDAPGWVVESSCDLRVGGIWAITFGPAPDQLNRHSHRIQVIDRPTRLVLDTTEYRADGGRLDFTTEFVFAARGDQTLMTMIQTGLPDAPSREEHARGLPNAYALFARSLRPRG
jgi:uncharacterized protein YndB with AHSA1/START domain